MDFTLSQDEFVRLTALEENVKMLLNVTPWRGKPDSEFLLFKRLAELINQGESTNV